MSSTAPKRRSPRLSKKQDLKRLKLDAPCPSSEDTLQALMAIFNHTRSVQLRYLFLKLSFCQFAPTLAKTATVTQGDKKWLDIWLQTPPNFWYDRHTQSWSLTLLQNLVEDNCCFTLRLASDELRVSLEEKQKLLAKAFVCDSIHPFQLLLNDEKEWRLKRQDLISYHNLPVKCFQYLCEHNIHHIRTNWKFYKRMVVYYLTRAGSQQLRIPENDSLILSTIRKLSVVKISYLICYVSLPFERHAYLLNYFFTKADAPDLARRLVVRAGLNDSTCLNENKRLVAALDPDFNFFKLFRDDPERSRSFKLCVDLDSSVELNEADIIILLDHRPLLSYSEMLSFKMTNRIRVLLTLMYLNRSCSWSISQQDEIELITQNLRPTSLVNQLLITTMGRTDNSYRLVYTFSALRNCDYDLAKFDVPSVRRALWQHEEVRAWLTHRFDKDLVSAQDWLAKFCLEFPRYYIPDELARNLRIIRASTVIIYRTSEQPNNDGFTEARNFWLTRNFSRARLIDDQLYVWSHQDI